MRHLAFWGALTVTSAFASPVKIGEAGLSVTLDEKTGRLVSCTAFGQDALVDDVTLADVAIGIETTAAVASSGTAREIIAVKRLSDYELIVGFREGELEVQSFWKILKGRVLSRRLRFRSTATEPRKLREIQMLVGRMTSATWIFPATFPPQKYVADAERTVKGSTYFPAVVADDGKGMSLLAMVNELHPAGDFAWPFAAAHQDGSASFYFRFDSYGWLKPGVWQDLGEVNLHFRKGDLESHLEKTREYFDVIGVTAPQDRPDWMTRAAIYSLHPCGRNEDQRADRNGLRLAQAYLPFLEQLGVNTIWMRPIEDEKPYVPRDYFAFQSGVGSSDDLKAYVVEAHRRGLRVWRDAVVHGGRDNSPRAKAHPEWLVQKEDGSHDRLWTYDYNHPTWIDGFSNIIYHLSKEYDLDGWRIDVAGGSRAPNWNPAIPYARGSYARCQGGLAQQRAIRAAARTAKADAATLGEVMFGASGAVSDAIYDYPPNLIWFYRFTDSEVKECVENIRRFLHEQQAVSPPGTLFVHYVENHDSLQSSLMHGRAASTALFAMTAFAKGIPLVYQEAEDGCFEDWRKILALRAFVPELTDGECDYTGVLAPPGVFACRRTTAQGEASVALVNFNGRRVRDSIRIDAKRIPIDLAPFGYAVQRIKGAKLIEGTRSHVKVGDPIDKGEVEIIEREGETIYRIEGAEGWFAKTAEGDFNGRFFVRHPGYETTGSDVYHTRPEGAVRWRSSLHPFGLTASRGQIGLQRGGKALVLSGLSGEKGEVVVYDRLGERAGLAIGVRGDAEVRSKVNQGTVENNDSPSDSLTGIKELTTVMCGWEWESGDLRVRVQRNGTLRGVWRKVNGEWVRQLKARYVRQERVRQDLFGNRLTAVLKQCEEIDCPIRLWKDAEDRIHFTFGPGDVRGYGINGTMKDPVWYTTRYVFTPGAEDFDFDCEIVGADAELTEEK